VSAGRGDSRKEQLDESRLRKEFSALPVTKDYAMLAGQADQMSAVFDRATTVSSLNPTDQILIMNFNKVLDPTSVVRESEYARTPQNMAILERARAGVSKFVNGGVLSTKERKEFKDAVGVLRTASREKYEAAKEQYTSIARDYGFEPKRLIPTEARTGDRPAGKPAGITKGSVVKGYIFLGGDPANKASWRKQ